MDGRHACIFAYGQTGAGKTHTMQGPEDDRGVYFRATDLIYETTQEQKQLYEFNVTLQVVEIYNEEIYDLLAASGPSSSQQHQQQTSQLFSPPTSGAASSSTYPPNTTRTAVEIRHGEQGVYLKNVTTAPVENASDMHAAIQRGAANRSVSPTAKNEHSSRSHSVLMIDIVRTSKASGEVTNGRLVLVDLAGSERLAKTETTGQRLREAQCISKSLCAISDVMSALLAKEKHIPFRNSKLTHMLQDSLGGSDNPTLMLIHVSPASSDVSETIDTLKFASRVTHIQLGTARRSERLEISRLNGIVRVLCLLVPLYFSDHANVPFLATCRSQHKPRNSRQSRRSSQLSLSSARNTRSAWRSTARRTIAARHEKTSSRSSTRLRH